MPMPVIESAPPTPAIRQLIASRLDAFNDSRTGPEPDRPLALLIHVDGEPVGGLWGRSYYQWLFVELLFVPETLRGRGIGRSLIHRAEQEARDRGCHGVWLDTFDFQARGFYEKLGYAVFGQIEDYPTGHRRYFLQRRL